MQWNIKCKQKAQKTYLHVKNFAHSKYEQNYNVLSSLTKNKRNKHNEKIQFQNKSIFNKLNDIKMKKIISKEKCFLY